jgi:hypothetical protein
MWILPKQLLTSAYVPDTKELGLDSEEFSQISEKSLMWRSKPSLSRTWLQRWKRNTWIQRLSSRILKPSLTNSFVERWTSSRADSLVNHSPLLESVKQLMTQDTCSHSSLMESRSANLELFSSKTYKESLVVKPVTENQFSNMSSENWNKWVTEQRQEYSQRKKLALLTKENESSSWATPRAGNPGSRPNGKGGKVLAEQAQQSWQTPTTMDIERTEEGIKKRIAYRKSIGRKYVEGCLTEQVKNWSTPTVMDTANIQQPRKKNPSGGQKPPLCQEVMKPQNWPTPAARDHKGANSVKHCIEKPRHNTQLPNAVMMNDLDKPQNWPTARARDWKDTPGCAPSKIGDVSLPRKVYGLQDQAKPNTDGKSQGSPKLNPNWVEQLMGLPVGWTQLPTEWTD